MELVMVTVLIASSSSHVSSHEKCILKNE